MVVGYGIQDLVVEVVSATQIRFGYFLAQLDKEVTSIEIVGLSITEDAGASLTYSASVNGVDATQTAITNGMQFTYTSAVDTDVDGLFEVTATLSSPFTSSLTVDFTSLKVNGEYSSPLGANMVLEVPDNAPTVVTQIADASTDEDSAYSYDTSSHFTDVDVADDLTFSISGAPSTLTIDADSGVISGTPLDADVGVHSIQVTATDQTSNSVTIDYDLTVVDVNNAPTGVPTVTGVTAVGKVLTVDEDPIDDADGITGATPTFEWYRTDTAGTKTKIDGASSNTYTLVNADVGSTISSTVFFTDDEGTAESVDSSDTKMVTEPNYVFDIQNVQIITASEASFEINNAIKQKNIDYTSGSQEQIIKFDLLVDATALGDISGTASLIEGFEVQLGLDSTKLESIGHLQLGGDGSWMMQALPTGGMSYEINNVTGNLAGGSSSEPLVDTDTSNDTTTYVTAERKLFTIYLNPKADVQSLDLSFSNMKLGVGEQSALIPSNFVETINLGAQSRIVDGSNNSIINIGLSFDKSGLSQSTLTTDANGKIDMQQIVDFDAVTLVDPSVYTDGVDILDVVSVLKDIVGLDSLGANGSAFHAADTNNDGSVDIIDAVNILKHIVKLSTMDTFDLIDGNGDRIVQLDPALGANNSWELIANGDVDSSGKFQDSSLISLDIV